MKTRDDVKRDLTETLFAMPGVLGAWEGGSAATGYLDAYSDLDLEVVCEDDQVEAVMAAVRQTLSANYGILREYRLPEPTWHGFSQCFYEIGDVPPLYYIDFCAIKRSIPDKFMESDRHGHAVVWFEKEPILDEKPTPEADVRARGEKFYHNATLTDFLMILETKKGIARNNFAEAFGPYYAFLNRNLGVMLNLKYRPVKVDFGLRYGYRDYAAADFALVEAALKVASVAEMALLFERLVSRYEFLKTELATVWS